MFENRVTFVTFPWGKFPLVDRGSISIRPGRMPAIQFWGFGKVAPHLLDAHPQLEWSLCLRRLEAIAADCLLVSQASTRLAETGFVEGRTSKLKYRWARGQYDQVPALATELVTREVNVIVAGGGCVTAGEPQEVQRGDVPSRR